MDLKSKYFDTIRIKKGGKSKRADTPASEQPHPTCQWKGCDKPGRFRAPKGRGRDGEFYAFCAEHVRQYNASYNYFDGMSDDQVEDFKREDLTGHRPTWKVGSNGDTDEGRVRKNEKASATTSQDFHAWRAKQARKAAKAPARKLKPLELKSVAALGLSATATREDIKTRYKELVKKHHPDANGGDRGSEQKLREIIQAYNYLKKAGLVS
ncbi:MAG: DnaJ domain-containing protein [Pseudomonadota bacterium]